MIIQKEKPEKPLPLLDKRQLEVAIEFAKETFSAKLSNSLNLLKVSAPLLLSKSSGLNDNLNGIEEPVQVRIKSHGTAEVVQSLAKWKRFRLKELSIPEGHGLYTNMNALRQDEDLSNIHSVYVDQWDWEKHICKADRSIPFLKNQVSKIYKALVDTEKLIESIYPELHAILPEQIHFIHSEDLALMYPKLSPKEREHQLSKSHGAAFIIGIGGEINGYSKPHDDRAPDYDDWSTPTFASYKGLNGDLIVWHPGLGHSLELSSMGIRVDKAALAVQLAISDELQREQFPFHQAVLKNELPLSIGGGIGQSRVVMFLLKKSHIGEVQHGIWPEQLDQSNNIDFL
jgi:aspartate--ammonia ligase